MDGDGGAKLERKEEGLQRASVTSQQCGERSPALGLGGVGGWGLRLRGWGWAAEGRKQGARAMPCDFCVNSSLCLLGGLCARCHTPCHAVSGLVRLPGVKSASDVIPPCIHPPARPSYLTVPGFTPGSSGSCAFTRPLTDQSLARSNPIEPCSALAYGHIPLPSDGLCPGSRSACPAASRKPPAVSSQSADSAPVRRGADLKAFGSLSEPHKASMHRLLILPQLSSRAELAIASGKRALHHTPATRAASSNDRCGCFRRNEFQLAVANPRPGS